MIGELKSSNRKPIKPEQVSSQIGSQLIQYPYNYQYWCRYDDRHRI